RGVRGRPDKTVSQGSQRIDRLCRLAGVSRAGDCQFWRTSAPRQHDTALRFGHRAHRPECIVGMPACKSSRVVSFICHGFPFALAVRRGELDAMPDRDLLSMLERLMGDEPGLLSMWSRMVTLIVENKASCGLAHLSDQAVADNAAGIFHGLMKLCVEAK